MIVKDSVLYRKVIKAIIRICDEKEAIGIRCLHDSDIYDIQNILKAQGENVVYSDIEHILNDLIK